MKRANLLSIVDAFEKFGNDQLFDRYLSFLGISIKEREREDLRSFINSLRKHITNIKVLDGYYFGFTIPQISKEFDILRIGKESIINIELKNETTEKIEKQLKQNRYYLNFLGKRTFYFTYITEEDKLYELENDNLVAVDFEKLSKLLFTQEIEEIENINQLFFPSNYLVSPFNSTDKFIDNEYFLTKHQEDIKKKIIDSDKKKYPFFTIKGGAGTGKTLLVYDIAKDLTKKGEKVLVIHCGNLNKGQEKLNEKKILNIISIKDIKINDEKLNFEEYSIIILDETQREKLIQLDFIIKNIKPDKKCIFSIDPKQCLKKKEFDNNIESHLKKIASLEFELTNNIRTNEELLSFINSIFHNKPDFKKIRYKNIDINYFNDYDLASAYLSNLIGWKIINYTPDNNKLKHSKYHIDGEENTHEIIGQEFDNVVVVIDDTFLYTRNKLSVNELGYYDKLNMFYQNITRARNKINIVILNNKEVLNRCLEVLTQNIL